MKQFLALTFFYCILFSTVSAQTNLTVANGSKNISKGRGQLAHVWSNPNPPDMVFDRWTGDTVLVQDIFAAHTRVNTSSKNINLTATYKVAPAWTPVEETINNASVLYHIPANHIGIIFRFHGGGGSNQFVLNRVEDRIFANEAVAAGYGIIALNSTNRTTAQWSFAAPPNNPDVTNVQTIITQFRQRGLINPTARLFSVGTSNGGVFSAIVSHYLNFKAAAIYIAFAPDNINNITNIPTIYCQAMNDDGDVGQGGNERARNQFLNLQSRGIRTSFNNHPPSPVYPERFWRIPGLMQADSNQIYNALKSNGFLDRRDYLIENPNTSNWQSVIPPQYASYLSHIKDQLEVCYTTHKFYSDYDSRILRFFAEVS